MRTLLRLTGLSALVLAGACSDSPTGGNQTVRELGFIQYPDFPVEITVPATARAGQPFTVRVTTRGDACTTADDTEVLAVANTVTVAPYDLRTTGPNTTCTGDVRSFVHTASVRLDTPGEATLNFNGRTAPSGNFVTLSRTVTVQPAT